MKTKLYAKWIKLIEKEFYYSRTLKRDKDGKYALACRIWNYRKYFPNADNWVAKMADEFKARFKTRNF